MADPLGKKEVYILIDQHTGEVHGTKFYLSEEHCIRDIQDRGFRYEPHINAIMPAVLTYKTDRELKHRCSAPGTPVCPTPDDCKALGQCRFYRRNLV